MRLTLFILFLMITGIASGEEDPVVIAMVEGLAEAPACRAVMSEAYSQLGIPIEFRMFSAAEALRNSNAGNVDAELQRIDGLSAKFENLVQVPIPIYLIQGVAFSRKYRFPVAGWHSLRPYRIGIVKGIVFALQNTADMDVQLYESYDDLVNALAGDEIDVAVMPRVQGLQAVHARGAEDITQMEGILETLFLYHYVHVKRADLVDRLIPVLKKMLLSGETRRTKESFLAAITEQP